MSLLVSRKLAVGDNRSGGSETTKSGTDEQERYMRLTLKGKQAHHCNAYDQQFKVSRYRRHWMKEKALTWGGLLNHELE